LGDGHRVACFRVTRLNELGEYDYAVTVASWSGMDRELARESTTI